MRLVFFFIIMIATVKSWSQETQLMVIKGKIVTEGDSPVSFVNITPRKDGSVGTYSSSTGKFDIKLPTSFIGDSLIFSCIGYENKSILIRDVADSILVFLKPTVYSLSDIVITYGSAEKIVREAIQNLKATLPSDKSILQGFFREVNRSDFTYDRLIEAAVDIFDRGYNPSEGNKNLQFKIRELRKSEDYMDLDWKAAILNYLFPKNGLNGTDTDALFLNDHIRNNREQFFPLINAPLNDKFLEFVNLKIDSTVIYGGEKHYCVDVSPKTETKGVHLFGDFYPYGKIFIRTRDLAIVEMDIQMQISPNERSKMESLMVPEEDYIFRTIIKYKQYKSKMYLSFLYRKSFRAQMNHTAFHKSRGKLGLFYDEKLYITNEILIPEEGKLKSFKRKERQNKNIDLYSENWVYNEDFWKTYNAVNENPLLPNVKTDLERESPLSEQFKRGNE